MNLMVYERISTTHRKAKEASPLADKLITLGKRNTSTAKKNAIDILGSKMPIKKLFDDIAPRFANRKGGYTRILQLAPRKGDGASMAILELTERKVVEKTTNKKEKKAKQPEEKAKEPKKALPGEKKQVTAKEKPQPAAPTKIAPATEAKEKIDDEKSKEKTKSEDKKMKKGFFKGLRRYFRGKSA